MKIEFPTILRSTCTQPAVLDAGIISAANNSRVRLELTLLANGPFYIKRGSGATSSNWDRTLSVVGQTLFLTDFLGDYTVSPAVTAGDINVASCHSDISPPQNQ